MNLNWKSIKINTYKMELEHKSSNMAYLLAN